MVTRLDKINYEYLSDLFPNASQLIKPLKYSKLSDLYGFKQVHKVPGIQNHVILCVLKDEALVLFSNQQILGDPIEFFIIERLSFGANTSLRRQNPSLQNLEFLGQNGGVFYFSYMQQIMAADLSWILAINSLSEETIS